MSKRKTNSVAVLAAAAIPLVIWGIPAAPRQQPTGAPASIRAALADPQLLRLDAGIFLLHASMTAVFIASPLAIVYTKILVVRLSILVPIDSKAFPLP